ncbi:hypothetical protein [Catellatospora tritici]|uniref:hypothetical protein n=1 Tax=Catellatospora tritici TaxID=2851566 RepID=UPI001C2D3A5E|nr:hypothetical protein [Catellatospora tritici]MBV1851572.1 hypothetical protein [Catellatospora tritici]
MTLLGGTAAQAASVVADGPYLNVSGGPACCICLVVLIAFGFGAYALGRRSNNDS